VLVVAAFQCIVRALYNLVVVHFAVSVSCKLSAEERRAWLVKGHSADCTRLESLLSKVIGLLTGTPVFDFDVLDPHRPAVCTELIARYNLLFIFYFYHILCRLLDFSSVLVLFTFLFFR